MNLPNDRRVHNRLTSSEIDPAKFAYDVRTRMTYSLKNSSQIPPGQLFTGAIKNVSAEGLCFISSIQLHRGDRLEILVSLPGAQDAVRMEAEARWSSAVEHRPGHPHFDTGVRVLVVEGKPVVETVYFDNTYHVHWSIVLESILGRFRILQQQKHSSGNNS